MDMKEGYQYLKSSPFLFCFFLFAAMPYISIMIGNYLNPIFISERLKAGGNIYALQELVIALGAIFAGLIANYLVNKMRLYSTIYLNVLVFTICIILMVFIPNTLVFLVLNFILGGADAGTRVARSTMIMNLIPNHMIGRTESFYNGLGLILRTMIIGLFTETIKFNWPLAGLFYSGLHHDSLVGWNRVYIKSAT
ncbi:MFS transporter [Bacillus smithii]|nr:MFS transporter [Bacillus smithii]MED1457493.1 MFS transporter [Bacillus smithii]